MSTTDTTRSFVVFRRDQANPRKAWELTANIVIHEGYSVDEAARHAVANALANLNWTEKGVDIVADVLIITTGPNTDFEALLGKPLRGDVWTKYDARIIHGHTV